MDGDQPFETTAYRQALGAFLTGVTVVTARSADGSPIGMTANSFTSVSLDPPLVLVCVGSGSSNLATFAETPTFAVNVLREGQHDLAAQFARRGVDRFAGVGHAAGGTGCPILEESLAWFDCTLFQRVVAGDHLILIGQVRAFGSCEGAPLGFSRGKFVVAREGRLAASPAEPTLTAYLIEVDGKLLMQREAGGGWTLPTSPRPRIGDAGSADRFPGLRLTPDSAFIYSIYEDADTEHGYLVYRIGAEVVPDDRGLASHGTFAWFSLDALPSDMVRRPLRALLSRYSRERLTGRFGVYVDSAEGGRVASMQETPQSWASLGIQ